MAVVWQVLFMACLPVAIILALSGRYVVAAVVFLVGIPVFSSLRNRAARTVPGSALRAELSKLPDQYVVPDSVRSLLSARNLDDIPRQVRVGSPYDATDDDVLAALKKLGALPPQTNYGVVYRACFIPFMGDSETPLSIRFGQVSTGVSRFGNEPKLDEPQMAWVLLTTEAVRWHFVSDRVPGMPPRNPMEALLAGVREVYFEKRPELTVGAPAASAAGPVRPLTFRVPDGEDTWVHMIMLATDPSTDSFVAAVLHSLDQAQGPDGQT
jgi:hypothetical protein